MTPPIHEDSSSACPGTEWLLSYISRTLDEEQVFKTDLHLAACPDCLRRVRNLLYIREHFDSLWENWGHWTPARVQRSLRVIEALERVREPAAGALAARWLRRMGEAPGIAARALFDSAAPLSALSAAWLPEGSCASLHPRLAGVGAPGEEFAEMERAIRESAEDLGAGRIEEARQRLIEIARAAPGALQSSTLDITREGRLLARVLIDAASRRILVFYWPPAPARVPELALLIPEDARLPPLSARLQAVEDAEYRLAEFLNCPDGLYSLEIGPP